jgi:hypothetical protein
VLGLALPTLAFTIAHDEVFDWGRWQAVGWIVLFATAPLTITVDLVQGRGPVPPERVGAAGRMTLAVLAMGAAATAITVWVVADTLTIRYLGCWCSFGAMVTGVAAVTGREVDARVARTVLVAVVAGLGLGLIRAAAA